MLFIGAQASGKSTIVKLLAIFRDIEFVIKKDYVKHFNHFNINSYFSGNNSYLKYTNPNYEVEYLNDQWTVHKSENFIQAFFLEERSIEEHIRLLMSSNENYNKQDVTEKQKLLKQLFDANWSNLSSILKKQIYIPAERILVSMMNEAPFSLGDVTLPNYFRKFGIQFEFARNGIKHFSIGFLKIQYKNDNGINKVYFEGERSLLLLESASGLQAIIPMQLVIEHLKDDNNDFIVEEPELNLYPTTQKEVIHFLIHRSIQNRNNNNLAITTHSPYILSALNNLLFAFIVARKHPKKKEIIQQIVSETIWINPDEFNAYYLSNGVAKQIFDKSNELISQNELDDISEDIQGENDSLMEIYKMKNND